MRCREAQLRLAESRRTESAAPADNELLAHLSECPDCARLAEAAGMLNQMFEAAAVNDTLNVVPISERKHTVETEVALRKRKHVPAATIGLPRRRRMGVGIAVAIAVLAILSVIPFGYDRIVGYDVAFAGVDKNLATDDHMICDMLFALGLVEAAVDVKGCDSTCCLHIIDLKSSNEVHLVVTALNVMNPDDLSTEIIPLTVKSSRSLLHQAGEKIFGARPNGA
ncbi:MAG: hypothetical protein DRP45_06660 [Candidatus Zixiibacteriota bacterium]|nr:MAG: hypothetical protein DRP45_06660 [candidate division Zixibacteria bacterium]